MIVITPCHECPGEPLGPSLVMREWTPASDRHSGTNLSCCETRMEPDASGQGAWSNFGMFHASETKLRDKTLCYEKLNHMWEAYDKIVTSSNKTFVVVDFVLFTA